jgi:hypothetical protein
VKTEIESIDRHWRLVRGVGVVLYYFGGLLMIGSCVGTVILGG